MFMRGVRLIAAVAACAVSLTMLAGCAQKGPQAWDPSTGSITQAVQERRIEGKQDEAQRFNYSYVVANSADVTQDVIDDWYWNSLVPSGCLWGIIEFADGTGVETGHSGVWARYGHVYLDAEFTLTSHKSYDQYELVRYRTELVHDGQGGLTPAAQ